MHPVVREIRVRGRQPMNELTVPPPHTEEMLERWYQRVFAMETAPFGDSPAVSAYIKDVIDHAAPEERLILVEQILPAIEACGDIEVKAENLKYLSRIAHTGSHVHLLERHDRRLLETAFSDFSATVNGAAGEGRCVLFVAQTPYFVILREAMYLRRNGYRVFLVSVWALPEHLQDLFEENFDAIANTFGSFRVLKRLLGELRPDIFHVQCWMWFYLIGRMVLENKGEAKVVCEFYDITSFYAKREDLCRHWSSTAVDFDFAMENYILARADAVITRFQDGFVEEWMNGHGEATKHLRMLPYPCREFTTYGAGKLSDGDGVVRLVYAGNIVPQTDSYPAELYPTRNMHIALRSMLEQGLAIDLLGVPYDDHDAVGFEVYKALAGEFPRFRMMDGIPPDRLAETLCQYDYAINLFHVDMKVLRISEACMRAAMPAKLFSYLEAGLPILVHSEYENMAGFIASNGFGLAVHTSEIGGIAARLKDFDYEGAVAKIKAYNVEHGMDRKIGRLIALYGEIMGRS